MGGGDKTLLQIDGKTMLESILAALDGADIAISANGDPTRFARFGRPVLGDGAFAGQGPLAGILAGMEWAANLGVTKLLTVPGDTPFLPRELAKRLAPAPGCATSNGRRHHLIALWPLSCRQSLRAFLSTPGPRHVVRFAESIEMRYVDFQMANRDPFANINSPSDLIRAQMDMGADSN